MDGGNQSVPFDGTGRHSIVIDRARSCRRYNPQRVPARLPWPRPWVEIIPVEVVAAMTAEDWLDSFPATSMAVTVYV